MTPETMEALKARFKPEEHKKRKLPGGGDWFYIPWQKIRDRLDEVDPCWECSYSDPVITPLNETVIRCKITIEQVTREGVGTAPPPEYNESGKRKGIGTPIEIATADAFKNAAEQFGVGAYVDNAQDELKGRSQGYSNGKNGSTPPPMPFPQEKMDELLQIAKEKGISEQRAKQLIHQRRDEKLILGAFNFEAKK